MLQTQIGEPSVQAASVPASRRIHWRALAWLLALVVAAGILQAGLDWAVHRPHAARKLTARLATAFGRPVEVSGYDVSLWAGPCLVAESIVVSEDPQFGNEYFLRADSLSMRVRWLPLLRGRISLDTLSFDHPSLNITANSAGRINLSDWLPRRDEAAEVTRGAPAFSRINLDSGRINFKSGNVKLPIALTEVNGFFEVAGGLWQINLDAQLMRAAVLLQNVGTLHLVGTVGGTTSRLRPADLKLNWSRGSLADLLRFLYGDDMGARGDFSLAVAAHAAGAQWNLTGSGQIRRLHRWDLPLRSDNPGLNFTATGAWLPEAANLQISGIKVETPHSNGYLSGSFLWNSAFHKPAAGPDMASLSAAELHVAASIGAPDILAFVRAFRSGISEQLTARGSVLLDLHLGGLPPQLESAEISTQGVSIEGGSLAAPLRLAPADMVLAGGIWSLAETEVVFEPDAGVFAFSIPHGRGNGLQPGMQVSGQADDARQISALAAALGYSLPTGWDVSGPVAATAEIAVTVKPNSWNPSGKIGLDGVMVRAPFLAHPLGPVDAQLDFSPAGKLLHVHSAQALGSVWTGELSQDRGADGWHGNLSADSVSVMRINDSLNPAKRQNFLTRIFPFFDSGNAAAVVPESLKWTGQLRINDLQLQQVHFNHVTARARLDRRFVDLEDITAGLGRGQVTGSFTARLETSPQYRAALSFRGVDLAALQAAPASKYFTGTATGQIALSAAGLGRKALADSLACRGQADVNGLSLKDASLLSPADAGGALSASYFPEAAAAFSCSARQIHFSDITLRNGSFAANGQGVAGLDQSLNFNFVPAPAGPVRRNTRKHSPDGAPSGSAAAATREIHLRGTLESPEVSFLRSARNP